MKNKGYVPRAAQYYLLRSWDFRISQLAIILLGIGFMYVLSKGVFDARGESYILLVLYTLHLGLSLVATHAMVINLTMKDVQSKRLEFLLAGGIRLDTLMHSYTFEIWRLGSIAPALLYIIVLMSYPFQGGIWSYLCVFMTSTLVCYAETFFLNVIALSRKNFKLYKQAILFLGCLFIFLIGNASTSLLEFLSAHGIALTMALSVFNGLVSILFLCFSYFVARGISSEGIFQLERV